MLHPCRSDTQCIVGHPVLDTKHDLILIRSPDLNVLDYAIWAEVEKRLRKQERNMPDAKHETRAQFEQRLDRTARNLPEAFINKSIGDLQKRCKLLYKAKGGLFEEGGRRARRPL